MRKTHTIMIAVLLSSTLSLSAQEDSQSGSRVPDPKPYADLLKEESGSSVKRNAPAEPLPSAESEPSVEKPLAKSATDAPAETPEEIREVDRILAEARMHLDEIEKESGGSEEEAQAVFDDFLARITERIRALKLKEAQKRASTREAPADKAGVVKAEVSDQGRQEPGSSDRKNPEPGSSVPDPAAFAELPQQGKEPAAKQAARVDVPEKSRLIEEVDRILDRQITPLPNHTPLHFPVKKLDGKLWLAMGEALEHAMEAMKALEHVMEAVKAADAVLSEKMDIEAAGSKSGGN